MSVRLVRKAVVLIAAVCAVVLGSAATNAYAVNLGRQVVSISLTVQPFKGINGQAQCPVGTVGVGGGYDSDSPITVQASTPVPGAGGWRVAAVNNTSQVQTVLVFAVCMSRPIPQITSAASTVHPGQIGVATAVCPAGTAPIGGGFELSSNLSVAGSTPSSTQPSWLAQAVNSSTSDGTVVAYAVCLPVSGRRVVSQSRTAQPDSYVDLTPNCAEDEVNTSGGFVLSSGLNGMVVTSDPETVRNPGTLKWTQFWRVDVSNKAQMTVTAEAVCLPLS